MSQNWNSAFSILTGWYRAPTPGARTGTGKSLNMRTRIPRRVDHVLYFRWTRSAISCETHPILTRAKGIRSGTSAGTLDDAVCLAFPSPAPAVRSLSKLDHLETALPIMLHIRVGITGSQLLGVQRSEHRFITHADGSREAADGPRKIALARKILPPQRIDEIRIKI